MKKILTISLSVMFVLALVGCSEELNNEIRVNENGQTYGKDVYAKHKYIQISLKWLRKCKLLFDTFERRRY